MWKTNQEDTKDLHSLFDSIKDDVSSYIEKRLEILKLRTYEKAAISSSYIVYGLILCIFIFTIFLLGLIALGFLMGEILGSNAAGFGILILLVALALGIFTLNAKKVRLSVTNLVVKIIKKIESDEH